MKPIRYNRRNVKRVKRQKSSHSKTSKKLIIFIITAIFGFTGLAMWLQLKTGTELSPTLITCFYAFCTGELWMLASIKKSKLRTGQKENQYKNFITESQINHNDDDDDDEPVG